MSNNYFRFKQFSILQERSAFRVGTDGVLLGAFADVTDAGTILDVGTGTCLIALMLAQRSGAEIVAIEPDADSFAEACQNAGNSKWKDRIRIENCRLQDFVPRTGLFDLLVTNPPYFIDSLKNPDPVKSKTRHNVTMNHNDILESADRLLKKSGRLQLILPYEEGKVFIDKAAEYGFCCNSLLKIKAVSSGPVIRMISCFSRKRSKVTEKLLTIEKGERHDYTDEYKNLTRNFYLNF